MMSTSISELCDILQQLLIKDANKLGRESGFIQRERKLNGASFAQSLVFGWQANPQASLEDLCQSASVCGVQISPQGLQERLNSPQACDFMRSLLSKALQYVVEASGPHQGLLRRFKGIYIQDSSKIELPKELASIWQANKQGEASLKVQTVMNYQQGHLEMSFASGHQHDCPLQTVDLPQGSLRLADMGYFNVDIFRSLTQRGVYWISRVPARAGIFQEGKSIHLAHWLAHWLANQTLDPIDQTLDRIDQTVELTAKRLACRLIGIRVPDDVAQQRRKRAIQDAKDRPKHRLKQETLDLCQWVILVTNLSPDQLSIDEALCLLRTRWQVELLFKLWKDELHLDEWRSKNPFQILCEVYAKLLLALIQHWLLILGCWDVQARSLVKATRALQKHAFRILACLHSPPSLSNCLAAILPTLQRCRIQKRKTRPATFQLLARSHP